MEQEKNKLIQFRHIVKESCGETAFTVKAVLRKPNKRIEGA